MIDEFLDFDDWAALARHLNCTVFELLERPDCDTWMELWKQREGVLWEVTESAKRVEPEGGRYGR